MKTERPRCARQSPDARDAMRDPAECEDSGYFPAACRAAGCQCRGRGFGLRCCCPRCSAGCRGVWLQGASSSTRGGASACCLSVVGVLGHPGEQRRVGAALQLVVMLSAVRPAYRCEDLRASTGGRRAARASAGIPGADVSRHAHVPSQSIVCHDRYNSQTRRKGQALETSRSLVSEGSPRAGKAAGTLIGVRLHFRLGSA
jgi:hypothetical protein